MAYADIEYAEEENSSGIVQPCVYAACQTTGIRVGPVWGVSGRSVRRALAQLSEECDCEDWHEEG